MGANMAVSSVGQLPAKLFDALAAGRPIVATNVNDAREVVADAGLIVPPSSPGELARAIRRFADDRDFARVCGERGRARAVACFSHAEGTTRLKAAIAQMSERSGEDGLIGERARAASGDEGAPR